MKNTFLYYLAVILPTILIVYLFRTKHIESGLFVGLLFFYLIVYRTFIDYLRLLSKNVIGKKDFWKILIPGFTFQYFRELYLP